MLIKVQLFLKTFVPSTKFAPPPPLKKLRRPFDQQINHKLHMKIEMIFLAINFYLGTIFEKYIRF